MRQLKLNLINNKSDSSYYLSFRIKKCGVLERLPKWAICIPLTIQWIWLSIRFRSITLPSAANPNITSGGLIGEGKMEYFKNMGPKALAATVRHTSISTAQSTHALDLNSILQKKGFEFPIIAKPDLGLCGFGVRRIDSIEELKHYISVFPPNETIVLQDYMSEEGEAGVFYARNPKTNQSKIIGLALRYFPQVIGDGKRSIYELITADSRTNRLLLSKKHELTLDIQRVPAYKETVRLSTIGSTRVGGLYRDASSLITQELTEVFDSIARDMPSFYFGRFDIRFDDLNMLTQGKQFKIIEINGAGSEAIHAWDPNINLFSALKIIFVKQRMLFEIGSNMRSLGISTLGVLKLLQLYFRQQRLIKLYPPSN